MMRLPAGYTGHWGSGLENGFIMNTYQEYLHCRLYRLDKLWADSYTCDKGCCMSKHGAITRYLSMSGGGGGGR